MRPGQVAEAGRSRRGRHRRQLPPAGPGRRPVPESRWAIWCPRWRTGSGWSWPRVRPWPCSASSSSGTCRVRSTRCTRCCAAAREFAMLKGRVRGLPAPAPAPSRASRRTRRRASSTSSRPPRPPASWARILLRLRDWSQDTETGDRDDLTPGVRPRLGAGVGVLPGVLWERRSAPTARSASPRRPASAPSSPRSSSPTTRCSRSTPSRAPRVPPQHEVLIVDEAHELVSRVTGVATGELTPRPGQPARCAAPRSWSTRRRPTSSRPPPRASSG